MKLSIPLSLFVLAALFGTTLFASSSGSMPVLPGSVMKITLVDTATGQPIMNGKLAVTIEYTSPSAKTYQYTVDINQAGQEVSLDFPPSDYVAVARIQATAAGYYDGEEIEMTSAEYWGKLGSGNPASIDTSRWGAKVTAKEPENDLPPQTVALAAPLLVKTFELEKKPTGTGCISLFIMAPLLGIVLLSRKNQVPAILQG